MASFLVIVVVFLLLMWFAVVLPQRRRQRAQSELIAGLEVGDEIVTAGGIYGTIVALADDEATVEIAPGTEVRIAKRALVGLVGSDEDEEAEQAAEGEDRS